MLKYAEALERIRAAAAARSLGHERVGLMDAVGRVCAKNLVSPERVPPFDNSAMDGFAVHSASAAGARRLRILGTIAAGDAPPVRPAQDGAWEIMTGAPIPDGFDAVVKIEDTLVLKHVDGRAREIEIAGEIPPKLNWRGAGEDFEIGAPVIARGAVVTPEHVLALSSLGLTELEVFRRPRIGLISTGRELVEMSQTPSPGQIRNSTAPYLVTTLKALGADVTHLGTIADEPSEFAALMGRARSENFDLLVTTGAVSMGKFDFVTEGLKALGAQIVFHKVAIRPGKPLLFGGFADGPDLFGFPGNPVSGVVALRFFLDPYLRALTGMKPERAIRAQLAANFKKPEGFRCFFKARADFSRETPAVSVLPGQMSFMVRPLLEATAWAVLPEEATELAKGASVEIYPMHFSSYDWSGK